MQAQNRFFSGFLPIKLIKQRRQQNGLKSRFCWFKSQPMSQKNAVFSIFSMLKPVASAKMFTEKYRKIKL